MNRLAIIMFFAIIGLYSCKDDEIIEPIGIGEVVRIKGDYILNLEDGKCYVCDNVGELNLLLGKDAPTNVNFEKNVMIIIKDTAIQGVGTISAATTYSNKCYDIKVTVTLDYSHPMDVWCIGIVMPRINNPITNLKIEYLR